jgi:hypothetical protein
MAFPPLLRIVLSRLPFLLFYFNELLHAHNTCAHMGLTLAALHVVCGPLTKKQIFVNDLAEIHHVLRLQNVEASCSF